MQLKIELSFNSGTGQHAKAFASYFSCASWEPTEIDESLLDDIKLHCKNMKNVKTPQVTSISIFGLLFNHFKVINNSSLLILFWQLTITW
jgi:hypothetical protein